MQIARLLEGLGPYRIQGDPARQVSSIVTHSRDADAGSLFVAIAGTAADGHRFLDDAYRCGARAFITEQPFDRPDATTVIVTDSRAALSAAADTYYGSPSRELTLIGITGTNGKTTTAFLLESMLAAAGLPAGLISTIEYRFGREIIPAERTTPDPLFLQQALRGMLNERMQYAVMEVSSHGLTQKRVEHCHFDVGIFTNLSPEHLDYHKTIQDYFAGKERLFAELLPRSCKPRKAAIINSDDPLGRRLLKSVSCETISFGRRDADVSVDTYRCTLTGIQARIVFKGVSLDITSPLIGSFNLYNILAALAAGLFLGLPVEKIRQGIAEARPVPGRMERIGPGGGQLVFVDYAHTPDALEKALRALHDMGADEIVTVFGCGGERDREKRPIMGGIAARYCRNLIVTSDNPRGEDPDTIIAEIEQGVRAQGMVRVEPGEDAPSARTYMIISDRRSAIRQAVVLARPDTVVLIAGKGHETYQQVGSRKIQFDDREEARQAMCDQMS